MKIFNKDVLKKTYEINVVEDQMLIELRFDGKMYHSIAVKDILDFTFFKPKHLIGKSEYWLSLKTKKNGFLFFETLFSDESFVKQLVRLISIDQLEKMQRLTLKKLYLYYLLPFLLLGLYFTELSGERYSGVLFLAIFLFCFNSIAVINEYRKFKRYKEIKRQ